MNRRDVLSKETFWTWIFAIALFYGFTLLPVCTYIFVHFFHFALRDSIVALATRLTIVSLVIPLIVWKSLDGTDEELKSSSRQAREVMLYGNPIGWVLCLLHLFFWKKLVVPLSEMPELMRRGAFPEDTE